MDVILEDKDKLVKAPLVSIRVCSYNHEPYIRQCLDSLLAQKTNFDYEIVMSNNPSEDKTREIAIEYQKKNPDKIRLLLREKNEGFFANFYKLGELFRGKYITRCDTDDFWCDEYKLQKQVDLMESDNSIGLCHTRSYTLIEKTQTLLEPGFQAYNGFKAHLLKEHILTLTVMHRRELYERYLTEIKPQDKGWLMEDSSITLWYSYNSKIVGINDISTVYRVVENSISHPVDYYKKEAFNKSLLEIRLFFYDKYNVADEVLKDALFQDYYRRNLIGAYQAKDLTEYFRNLRKYNIIGANDLCHQIVVVLKLIARKIIR